MKTTHSKSCTTKKNQLFSLASWTGGWIATMALVAFGPKFLWEGNNELTLILILVNIILGIGMILANRHHLMGLDELQRKIHLEAMAITLGLAVILGLAYSMLDVTNLISFDAEISHLVILIGLTYLAGTLIGGYRYR